MFYFYFSTYPAHTDLHSFPTRRSSDLAVRQAGHHAQAHRHHAGSLGNAAALRAAFGAPRVPPGRGGALSHGLRFSRIARRERRSPRRARSLVARFSERRPRHAQGDAAARHPAAQAPPAPAEEAAGGGRLSARVTLAYVAIGSNLGRPVEQVEQAFEDLGSIAQTVLVKRSSLYRSKPLGYADQPPFVNAVALLDTALPPEGLLAALQAIEAQHGRSRSFANAPRTLDLDLLLYGDAVVDQPRLVVPHPRMHLRAFVLQPLVEIAGVIAIPGIGAAQAMLEQCGDQSVERISG